MVKKLVISKSRHNLARVHWSKVFFNKHIKNNMYSVQYVYTVYCTVYTVQYVYNYIVHAMLYLIHIAVGLKVIYVLYEL